MQLRSDLVPAQPEAAPTSLARSRHSDPERSLRRRFLSLTLLCSALHLACTSRHISTAPHTHPSSPSMVQVRPLPSSSPPRSAG